MLCHPPRHLVSLESFFFLSGLFISFIAQDLRGVKSTVGLYIQAAVEVKSSEVKSEFSSLADLAAGVPASQVRVVTLDLLPGLLQTRGYCGISHMQ